ncbi:hypothetical protein NKH77_02090 [Streptomyces sp. M19]
MQALIDHHAMLRLSLTVVDGLWALEVLPRATVELNAPEVPLTPEHGPVVHARWRDGGPARPGELTLTAHHLAVDGVSWRILQEDLRTAWEAVRVGDTRGCDRRAPPSASGRGRWSSTPTTRPYWRSSPGGGRCRRTLRRAPRAGRRGGHRGHPARALRDAARRAHRAPGERRDRGLRLLGARAAAHRVRAGRRGLAAGPDALLVDLEGHGREEFAANLELSRTVGWFTTLCPVVLDPGCSWADARADPTLLDGAVAMVREGVRDAARLGLAHGLLRHLNPQSGPVLAARPAPRFAFNYLGRFDAGGATGARWPTAPCPARPPVARWP